MKLSAMLSPSSLKVVTEVKDNLVGKARHDYIMKCLKSRDYREVAWAQKQLGIQPKSLNRL